MRQKKAKGEWTTRIPIGFCLNDEGKLKEDPVAMKKIKRAKRLSREGKSIRYIADAMGLSKDTGHKWIRTDLRTFKCNYINA